MKWIPTVSVLTLIATQSLFASEKPFSPELEKVGASLAEKNTQPLTKDQANLFLQELQANATKTIKSSNDYQSFKDGKIIQNDLTMPFNLQTVGQKSEKGWPLFISLHGGGTCPKPINDGQWRNQIFRYNHLLKDCKYIAPRAPKDQEPWHPYMYDCIEKLVTYMILTEEVDPNRVYFMGYSEGGYACFRIIPGLSERFAAIAPGGAADILDLAPPENLANIAFNLQVGEYDRGFDRIGMARKYSAALDQLEKKHPGLYKHHFIEHKDEGHDVPDYSPSNASITWMLKHVRNPAPKYVAWNQGKWTNTKHYYWLSVNNPKPSKRVIGKIDGNTVTIETKDYTDVTIRLNDNLVDLNNPVTIIVNGQKCHEAILPRQAKTIAQTWSEHFDPQLTYSAQVTVKVTQ